jgi:hypothetical protein
VGQAKGKMPKNNRSLWLVTGAAVIAVGAMIGLSIFLTSKEKAPEPTAPTVAVKTDAEVKGNRNQQGNPTAKVEIVEWGDYT